MASIMRPTMLRQTALAAASKRALTTKTSAFPIALSKPTASAISRQTVKSAFVRNNVAAFHAGGRQQILPPGPRTFSSRPLIVQQSLTISQRSLTEPV